MEDVIVSHLLSQKSLLKAKDIIRTGTTSRTPIIAESYKKWEDRRYKGKVGYDPEYLGS